MKVIKLGRGEGKTRELIKLSEKEGHAIVVRDKPMVRYVQNMADYLDLKIIKPITYYEFRSLKNPEYRSVLIDDLDFFFRSVNNKFVVAGVSINDES